MSKLKIYGASGESEAELKALAAALIAEEGATFSSVSLQLPVLKSDAVFDAMVEAFASSVTPAAAANAFESDEHYA